MRASGFHHAMYDNNSYVLLAGGGALPLNSFVGWTSKTEYEYAQYLSAKIKELNVGWDEGLNILRSQNGQLMKAESNVIYLEDQLAAAEKASEEAYERMAYAHSGIFGDDEIVAKKKELAEAERAAESNKKLESSYKGLAEAVEQYVESSKKLCIH